MAGGTNVPSKIPVTSLDSAEHKIPGRKTKRRGRTKCCRRSFDEVCLDNADTFIDGGTTAKPRRLPSVTLERNPQAPFIGEHLRGTLISVLLRSRCPNPWTSPSSAAALPVSP